MDLTLVEVQYHSVRRAEGNGFYTWDTERKEVAAGQFSVRVRGRDGRVHRTGGLTWFDTDVGAYCATTTPGHDWVNVTPIDGPRLADRLATLVSAES